MSVITDSFKIMRILCMLADAENREEKKKKKKSIQIFTYKEEKNVCFQSAYLLSKH